MKKTKLLLLPIFLLSLGSCGSNNTSTSDNTNNTSNTNSAASVTSEEASEEESSTFEEESSEAKTNITVTLVKNNNEENEDISVNLLMTDSLQSAITSTPSKDYYNFEGWYTDEALTNKADLTSLPNDDITLYANYATPIQYFESIPTGSAITIWGYVRSIGTSTISSNTTYEIILEGMETGEMYYLYKNETYLNSVLGKLKCGKSFIKVEGTKYINKGSYPSEQFYYVKPKLVTDLTNEANIPEMPQFQSFENALKQELSYSLFEDTFTLRAFHREDDDENVFYMVDGYSFATKKDDFKTYTKLEALDGKIYYAIYPYRGRWNDNGVDGEEFSVSNTIDKKYKVIGYIDHKTDLVYYTFFTPIYED